MQKPAFAYCLILFMLSLSYQKGIAQRHSRCGSNPVPLANFCADACIVCDLNGVTARTTNTITGQMPPGYCTMVQHSMQWLAFIAGSTSLSINVSVSNCNQNNGVEMGIYASDDCQSFRLVSNCNTNMYANQTWPFTTTEPLKVGCVYYLVFDGNGPNSCDVLFTVTSGSAAAPIPNTNNAISGKKLICKGETVDYSISTINGACSYEWRIENGTINLARDNRANVTWDQPGFGKICVKGINDCHTGNEVCFDVEIGDDTPLTELGPYYVCHGGTYRYNNFNLTAGTWEYFFKNRYGCDSNITVVVEEFEPIESWIDTFICYPGILKIGNKNFDSTGLFKMVFKSKLSPFCDSTLFINLKYSKIIAIPNKTNDLSCNDTLCTLYADSSLLPKTGKYSFLWTNQNKDTLGRSDRIVVTQSGEYYLTLIYELDSLHHCISKQSIMVNGNRSYPQLVLQDSLQHCAGDTLYFKDLRYQDVNNTNSVISFHSSFPCTASNKMDSAYLVLFGDSTIYLNAANGSCEQAIPLPFRIHGRDSALFQDVSICFGDEIDLSALPYSKIGNFSGSPGFYYCAIPDTNCRVNSKLVNLNTDTMLYVYPDSATCPDFSSFKIKVNPLPYTSFNLNKADYCLGDTMQLSISVQDTLSNYFFQFDQVETKIGAALNSVLQVLNSAGTHSICIRGERLNCRDSSCQAIAVYDPPQLPIIDCIPTDSSILFYWNYHPGESYTIGVLQGGTYTRLTDTSVLFSNLSRGENVKIKVIAGNPYCKDQVNEIECQSKTCPPVQLDIVPVDTICLNTNTQALQLFANTSPVQNNGSWRWAGSGIVDSLQGVFDPLTAGVGNHRIFVALDQHGCKYFSNTLIVVRDNPISEFTLDSVACRDSAIHVVFKGSKADSANFNWNFDGGNFQFLNGNREASIKWSQAGKKKLKLKLNHYRCYNEKEHEIEVLDPLSIPNIDCENTDSLITFRWNKVPRAKKYKIKLLLGNTGQLINDTSYVIAKRFYNDSATIELSLEDDGPCSDVSSNAIHCKSPDCPPRNMVYDTVLNYCEAASPLISLQSFVLSAPSLFNWTGPALQNGIINTAQLKSGQYLYTLNGSEFGCQYKDSLLLQINPSPGINQLSIQDIGCDPNDQTGIVQFVNVQSPNPPLLYSLDGNSYQAGSLFDKLPEGKYVFFVKDNMNCISDTVIELTAPEIPAIDLGPDLKVPKNKRVQLNASVTGRFLLLDWLSNQSLSCVACVNPFFNPKESTIIYCLVTNEEGCTAIDSIVINVFENNIYAPSAFTPNGDNINDFFSLFGSAQLVINLEIYDRWGESVFSKQNFPPNETEKGWNGRFRDEPCIPGVYVYYAVVKFENGEERLIKGDVVLVR